MFGNSDFSWTQAQTFKGMQPNFVVRIDQGDNIFHWFVFSRKITKYCEKMSSETTKE